MSYKKNAPFMQRFSYALNGLVKAWQREASLRFQSLIVGVLIGFCLYVRPSAIWCAVFAGISALVLSLELVNSAVEALLDRMHPEEHHDIGFAKDCLAGAVLISSLAAVIIFIFFFVETYS